MTAQDPTRESGQEGSASESTRRQFLGAAAAVASIGVGGVGDGPADVELVYVDEGESGWYPLDQTVAADVWAEEFQEARIELLEERPDLDRAADLLRRAARRLEERDAR